MPYYRKLFRADLPKILAHFLDLSPEDRRRRFRCPASDDFIRLYCRGFRWSDRAVIGAFRFDRLLGIAESVRLSPERAEIAVSVAARWQGLGIGRELVRRAAASAANRGLAVAVLDYAPVDRAIPHLVRSLGGRVGSPGMPAELALPAHVPAIEIEEFLEDVAATAAWILETAWWPWHFAGGPAEAG